MMKLAATPIDGASSVESLMEYSYGEQALDSLGDPKVQLRIAAKRVALDLRYAQAAQHESRGKNARRSRPPAEQSGRECDARVDRPSASIRPGISSSSGSTLPHIATGRDSSRTNNGDAPLSVKTAARHAGLAELPWIPRPFRSGIAQSESSMPPCSDPPNTSQTPARFRVEAVSMRSSAPASTVASPTRFTKPQMPARRPNSAARTPLSARLISTGFSSDNENPDQNRASEHMGSVPAFAAAQLRLLPDHCDAAGGTTAESSGNVESRGRSSFSLTLRNITGTLWTKLHYSHAASSDEVAR
jgi:hypothetical protein